jgi:hypothetical protein
MNLLKRAKRGTREAVMNLLKRGRRVAPLLAIPMIMTPEEMLETIL